MMIRMDIQGRIFQSIRPRRDGLLLRSDVSAMGGQPGFGRALGVMPQGLDSAARARRVRHASKIGVAG